MKGKIGVFILAGVLALISTANTASAMKIGGIPESEAVVVYWQIENGRWKACGPIQRVSLSYESIHKVISLAMNEDKDTLGSSVPVFSNGYSKQVHTLDRDLTVGDFDARRCLEDKDYQ